jgi:hypothetical protein
MSTFENPAARGSIHSDKISIDLTRDLVPTTPNKNPNDISIDITGGIDSRRSTLTPRDQQREFVITPSRELNGHVTHTKDADQSDYSSGEDDDEYEETRCMRCTDMTHGAVSRFLGRHSEKVKYMGLGTFALMFAGYFIYACVNSVQGALALIILTFLILFVVLALVVHRNFGDALHERCCGQCTIRVSKCWRYFRW